MLRKHTYSNIFIYILRLWLTIKDFLRQSVLHTGTLNFLMLRSCLWSYVTLHTVFALILSFLFIALGFVHTNPFSKVFIFVVIENASIDWCPHYRFDAFSTVHTKMFENYRIALCDVSWTIQACYKHTHPRYSLSSFDAFRPFSTVHFNAICVRFRFDPFSREF